MPDLVKDAREILANDPTARVAGLITLPDSRDADAIRAMLASNDRAAGAPGLLVGVVPRAAVEQLLVAHVGADPWKEGPGESQLVLPVVVSTRDGFRFGFSGLDEGDASDPRS